MATAVSEDTGWAPFLAAGAGAEALGGPSEPLSLSLIPALHKPGSLRAMVHEYDSTSCCVSAALAGLWRWRAQTSARPWGDRLGAIATGSLGRASARLAGPRLGQECGDLSLGLALGADLAGPWGAGGAEINLSKNSHHPRPPLLLKDWAEVVRGNAGTEARSGPMLPSSGHNDSVPRAGLGLGSSWGGE